MRKIAYRVAVLLGAFFIAINLVWAQKKAEANPVKKACDGLKDSKKLVLAWFTADWCGWCTKMEKDVLGKDEVKKLMSEKFVLVKVDEADYPKLIQEKDVHGFPVFIVYKANEEEVSRQEGACSQEVFQKFLNDAWNAEFGKK